MLALIFTDSYVESSVDSGFFLFCRIGLLNAIPAAPQAFCENQAANAIISHYAALCQEQGAEMNIRLVVPARTEQVSDAELCVIFGNLLENALEACGHMTEGRKFLRLSSDVHLGTLTITAVSCKHGGNARFGPDGRVFLSSVYVRL